MLQTVPSSPDNLQLRVPAQAKLIIGVILAMWFSLIVVLGTGGAFAGPPGRPPLPILVAVVAPLALFFIASRLSPWVHGLVMAADLRVLVSMQAWRAGGLGFLALYAHGVLPGFFAFPAGLGDIAIGVTAPLMLLTLLRRPDFVASRRFRRWNWLGILDLVVALSLGAFGSMLARGVPGEITTGVMAFMPEVIIPAYLVPIFLMLHMTSLMQSRRLRASA